ncbi:peptidase [Lysinibacillus sp. BF-4]|uniref:Protease PrsW n=1 Tax=Metalysinibacillus saudimassiliensis TaxID=1461583 RepID=A0A078MJ94_9BACL|nr:glutamic-type intramembrane protease PrsW [Lysinibacillus sp. BF-4]KFL44490.1 peptidase [Lysinibacillus sp. BF-4]CEA04776.1 Protease PrsW [Metalysinibacillus saudimassiliensis]
MFILLSAAIAPSLALFSYFYLRNQMATEPRRTLFHTFIYGVLITFPILFLQYVFVEEGVVAHGFAQDVLFSSTIEEFFKWFLLLIAIYNHVEFDDPYDGILYGASISLGFATVENVLYLITFGVDTAFLRALLPVSSHALFGVVMGYYFGQAKISRNERSKELLAIALFAPMALHIIYNGILTFKGQWMYLIVPFMLFLWWFGLRKVKLAHQDLVRHLHEQNKL